MGCVPDSPTPNLKNTSVNNMKKFYAILKGVFAVMMSSTLLMTSCNPYTPHETPDEFKGLNELMSKLEEYVEDEMATFATLINDQTVVKTTHCF